MNFDDDKLREAYERMMESIRQAQLVALKYELAEGFLYQREDGMYSHTTPEMLGIDIDTNFFRETLLARRCFFGTFFGFFSHTFLCFVKRH